VFLIEAVLAGRLYCFSRRFNLPIHPHAQKIAQTLAMMLPGIRLIKSGK
jgi:hypothetical protein